MQTAQTQNAASDQCQHCLHIGISVKNSVKSKIPIRNAKNMKWTHPSDMDEQVHRSKGG